MNRRKLLPVLLALAVAWLGQTAMAQVLIYDDSDAPFTILPRMVTVTSPNGGENWNNGSAHDVTWTLDASIAFVNIHYSTDNGASWLPAAVNAANSGSRSWTLPAVVSTTCLVRVSAANHPGNNDFSDRAFSISDSGIETVTAPNAPSGPASGMTGNGYSFSAGGANSNFGDPLQYRIDWGDGTDSGWLVAGTTSASHAWAVSGTYQVRAMARCAIHQSVESPWSEARSIIINVGIPGVQWNTFLGGSTSDKGWEITTDGSGNIYVIGDSPSTWGSPQRAYAGQEDAFVAKLDANGALLWHTFLGSTGPDSGHGIAVGNSGNVIVTGTSNYTWGTPLQAHGGGTSDAFVAKISSSGALLWHTFLGGSGADGCWDVTVDGNENAFVTGFAADWGSPLNPYGGGSSDAFVAKLNAGGALQWHTFLGGKNIGNTNNDCGYKITTNGSGNIYATGYSTASWGSPINPFAYSIFDNYPDAFLVKLNANGTREWNTFLGGSYGKGVVLNDSGDILVVGWNSGGGSFVVKTNASGTREWKTALPGLGVGSDIALDQSGYILLAGSSSATWGSPLHPHGGGYDACLAKLDPDGSLQWNTFLGGAGDDEGYGIAWDNSGNIVVTGRSTSTWGSPLYPHNGNSYFDAFVAKMRFTTDALSVITPNGGEDWAAASSHFITWSLASSVTSVTVDYSADGGGTWIPVAAGIANNGAHGWTVPATPSLNCFVRVSDAANPSLFDVSDEAFYISASSVESVTAPAQPSGPNTCMINTSYSFSTGGATSSLGHALQYRLDWGDGSDSGWLAAGSTSAAHSWEISGTYNVRAMARCATHTGVESPWSGEHSVVIPAVPAPVLHWNTFLGGSEDDDGKSVIVDGSGNIYIVGSSYAAWGSPLNPYQGGFDVFVAKLNPGGVLQWHTFLGGSSSNYDYGRDIAVDASGNIYITGISSANWGSPIVPYAGGSYDAFVAKLNADGILQWHTFMGGTGYDGGTNVAVDNSGSIYVLGSSQYYSWGNPLNPFSGNGDAFLAKFNGSGVRQWHTFFKGSSGIFAKLGMAVDGSGNVLVAAGSGPWGTPLNPHSGAGVDILMVKFNSSGARQWHTFLGGSGNEAGCAIAMDGSGNLLVTGHGDVPWGSPLNPHGGGADDAFVAKFDPDGTVQWHTFMGGSDEDEGYEIAANQNGEIHVAGFSALTWGSPLDPHTGSYDGFVAKINPDGAIQYHTFLGGWNWDKANGITLDGFGNIVISGESSSAWGDPINPFQAKMDAFVTKLCYETDSITVTSPNGGENWAVASDHYITWISPGSIASVNIDYSTDNGANWSAIASGIANAGYYAWTVPNTPSADCRVRVSDAADGDPGDESDAAFVIMVAVVEFVSPPAAPAGPIFGLPGIGCSFSTGGSTSSFGHAIQYRFDWGDGSDSGWLAAGTTSAVHSWTAAGIYNVRATARCILHPAVESAESEACRLIISGATSLLQWNTFLGGGAADSGKGIALDGSGNILVSGESSSTWGTPLSPYGGGNNDAYVAKLNAGGGLQWHTFLGSNDFIETANKIAIDSSGNVFVTGISFATWGSPLNPFAGDEDVFIAKLNASGALLWHTFLGGSGYDRANGIVVDGSGDVFIAGESRSTWGSPLNAYGGGTSDAFVAKVNASGELQWHTFMGGSAKEYAFDLAMDGSGNIFVVGCSYAGWGSPLQPYHGGTMDAFAAKLDAGGTRAWHTFIGGAGTEEGRSIALDDSGNILLAGGSFSTWGSPLHPHSGGLDAFAAKLDQDGALQWNTFQGGPDADEAVAITCDSGGNAYFTGEGFGMAELNASGMLLWSLSLGGSGISLDDHGNVFMTGGSNSTWGMPLRPYSGSGDAFAAKLAPPSDTLSIISPNGGESWAVESTCNITWSLVYSIAEVNIDYSTDGGGSWTAIAAGAANTGSYAWTVPYTPSDSCLVRVSDAADPGSGDGSDAAFSIYVPATLTISGTVTLEGAPVAGVLLSGLPGDPVTDDSGFYAATVAFGWSGTVTPSLQYFTFTPASTDYVSIYSNQSTDYAASISQPLIVTSPAAGAQWERGLTHAITWVKQGEQHEYVRIYLFKGTNTLVKTLVAQTDNDGSYDWAVPANQVLGTTYYIRVKTADGQIYDNSDKFSIIKPTITVTAPASGTVWAKGTVKTIAWTKQGTQDESVKIQLYKGTAKALDIALETENDGSYDWPIPSALAGSSNYTVRVATLDGLVTGKGKAFTITAGTLQVTQPEAGTAWERGLPHVIAWSGEGTLNANVRIDLYKGTTKVLAIVASTPTVDGAYTWTIPAGQALSSKYKVRIRTLDNLVKADSGKFSIVAGAGLALTAPNGNEALQAGEPYDIRWTDDAGVLEVKLEFSRDNGGTFATIADHVEDTGSYEWTVPVSFTANGIVRVSDAGGRLWQEEGLLEYAFRFLYSGSGDDPGMGFWFGSADANAPSYGFGRIDISGNAIGFGGMTKAVEPLAGSWHELRVRLDLRRDTAVIYLDDQVLFEHAALGTTRERYFEPGLALQAGSGKGLELALDDLAINVIRQDAGGEDREAFSVLKDDFERYDAKANPIGSCWQVPAALDERNVIELNMESPADKCLRLRTEAGKRLMLRLPFSLPERVPFDISDKIFTIENRQP